MNAAMDLVGWAADGFTLIAFAMKTMLPLRVSGACANLCFIAYGANAGILPVLVLHLALLPVNLWRLAELLLLRRRTGEARKGHLPLDWVCDLVRPKEFPDKELNFREGAPPDNLYYLESGRVLLEEAGIELGAGEIFGEIAFFSAANERTLTARCLGPCRIATIGERQFTDLHYRNPAFALYVAQLAARRLLQGVTDHPEAYRPLAAAPADQLAVTSY